MSSKARSFLTDIREKGNFNTSSAALDYLLELLELPEHPDSCVICGQWIIHNPQYNDPICHKRTCEDEFGKQESY
ncbi:MAG: hypothetical protein OXM61_17350 [Candidatus Poribacteria bacterium]|nr:hypothetical protein [Candidatus Poribacteria bacterium]